MDDMEEQSPGREEAQAPLSMDGMEEEESPEREN
jgi:hypothetical protein